MGRGIRLLANGRSHHQADQTVKAFSQHLSAMKKGGITIMARKCVLNRFHPTSWMKLLLISIFSSAIFTHCSKNEPFTPPDQEPPPNEGPMHKIVFSAKDAQGQYRLYLVNDDGSELKAISSPYAELGDLWTSPKGNRIVCVVNTATFQNPDYQLVLINIDGSGTTQIRTDPLGLYEEPQWFSSGEEILYGLHGPWRGAQIFRIRVDGTNQARITKDDKTSHRFPRLSPDGKKVAFEKRGQRNTVWVINIDGTNEKFLSDPASTKEDWQPEWVFDASSIIYANLDGLWSIKPDGNDRKRIPNGGSPYHCSPIEGKIVCGLHTMNIDGSGLKRLTDVPVSLGGYPILWSRDGTKIAFRGDVNGDGKEGICIITAQGTGLREITNAQLEIATTPIRTFDWVPAKEMSSFNGKEVE
jgi:Tol biopolymer transport system component